MNNWLECLLRLQQQQTDAVMVTVVSIQGSTPREAGAKMIVTSKHLYGTIGGGHLEFQACMIARNQLADQDHPRLSRFPLGAGLGQCCGGVVNLLFEPVTASSHWVTEAAQIAAQGLDWVRVAPTHNSKPKQDSDYLLVTETSAGSSASAQPQLQDIARRMLQDKVDTRLQAVAEDGTAYFFEVSRKTEFRLVLFGAGHVGRALVKILSDIPLHIRWIDTRDDSFPAEPAPQVETLCTDTPEAEIDAAEAGCFFLVMTHDHSLDQRLCEQILKRDDFGYFGLIGSATKRRLFETRMRRRGFTDDQFARMICPIGIEGILSKQPAHIAISVAAEIIRRYDQIQSAAQPGLVTKINLRSTP